MRKISCKKRFNLEQTTCRVLDSQSTFSLGAFSVLSPTLKKSKSSAERCGEMPKVALEVVGGPALRRSRQGGPEFATGTVLHVRPTVTSFSWAG